MAWNGSENVGKVQTPKVVPVKRKPTAVRGIVAGVVVVLAGCAALWLFVGKSTKQVVSEGTGDGFKESRKDQIVETVPSMPSVQTNVATIVEDVLPTFNDGRTSEWSKKFSKDSTWNCTTNSMGKLLEVVNDHGRVHKRVSDARPPMFSTASDVALAQITSGDQNAMLPPILVHPDAEKQFRESLKVPIVINDDDSPEVKERKEAVIEARQAMKELLDSGESFSDAIQKARDEYNHQVEMRNQAKDSIIELERESAGSGKEALARYNKVLKNMGLEELSEDDFQPATPKLQQEKGEKQ